MKFKGNITNKNELPSSSEEGDMYIISNKFCYYVWETNKWILHYLFLKI